MNCFSHAYRFLDRDPRFIVGTAIPDWLTLVDRKVRARKRLAMPLVENESEPHNQLASGIVQHHDDDDWFHANPTFVELNLNFAVELRELLGKDAGFRPHLSAHIAIEVLIDGCLAKQDISKLESYYKIVSKVDPAEIETGVNRIATKKTSTLGAFIPRFISERYLFDYLTDKGVGYRLNRVLRRIKLPQLPDSFIDWLASARLRVDQNLPQLLSGF